MRVKVSRRPTVAAAIVGAALLLAPAPARAFVYGEHRAIAGEAIAGLDPEYAGQLAALWEVARTGEEGRLCAEPWAGSQGLEPACFDLAAWSALAADHSCSPEALLELLLEEPRAFDTAALAAREAHDLEKAEGDTERRNAAARSQVGMARLDPAYAKSAAANNAHFLLGRQGFEDVDDYVARALAQGTEWNALSNFLFFHGVAMVVAARPEPPEATLAERAARARLILALESFAEHFLEDMFAAGHIAGSWGDAAIRKGTHDFYNRNGLDTESWKGDEMLLFGDSYMTEETRRHASRVVRLSLEQLLDAAAGDTPIALAAASAPFGPEEVLAGASSTCLPGDSPGWQVPESFAETFEVVVQQTAVPYREEGPGALPRYRAEIGPFLGLAGGGELAGTGGGFDEIGASGWAIGSLSLGLRFGVGLEELLSEAGDGLIFLDLGVAMSSAEPTACDDCAPGAVDLFPRVPARTGIQTRLRMPFWIFPGDLVLAAPLLLFSPDTYARMAIGAANGGLLLYERKFATPVGHFQVVLGREIGATFYGFVGGDDVMVTGAADPEDPDLVIIGVRTISLEAPVVEWEPFRSYGAQQTLGIRLQLGAGMDTPVGVNVLEPPTAPLPQLNTRYFGYLKLVFEARRYF